MELICFRSSVEQIFHVACNDRFVVVTGFNYTTRFIRKRRANWVSNVNTRFSRRRRRRRLREADRSRVHE